MGLLFGKQVFVRKLHPRAMKLIRNSNWFELPGQEKTVVYGNSVFSLAFTLKGYKLSDNRKLYQKIQGTSHTISGRCYYFLSLTDENGDDITDSLWTQDEMDNVTDSFLRRNYTSLRERSLQHK